MAYRAARPRRGDNLSYFVLLCVTAGTAYANYAFWKMRKDGTFTPILDQIDVEKEREHLGLNADHALREAQHRIDREAEEQAAQTGFATVVREQKSAAAVAPTQQAVQSLPPQRGWSWSSLKFW